MTIRVPPHHIESEQSVLGGLLLAPEAWPQVADLLQPRDFYRRDHQLIFEAIQELEGKKKPFDWVNVDAYFTERGTQEQIGGGAYLVELASTTPGAANIRGYAQTVADKATLRNLIDVGTEIVNMGFSTEGREADELCAEAAAKTSRLTLRAARDGGLTLLRSGLDDAWDDLDARFRGTAEVGLPPPWKNVARKLPGLEDTDLFVLAARPSMGKTAAAMEWAAHADDLGRNVAVFSMEMSKPQLLARMLSRQAKVDHSRMREKDGMTQDDWAAMTAARRHLSGSRIAIDDTGSLTIDAIRARASRMHAKVDGGLGLIVVDYIQLISGTGRSDESRSDQVTKISRGLKLMAKDLKCPVIALSQLNRSVEARADKRPMMSDLRESGAIEQDADIIGFLFRDDYYTKDACGAPGVAELILAKQRQGPTGTAYLKHHLEYSSFEDYYGRRPDYTPIKIAKGIANDEFDDFGND